MSPSYYPVSVVIMMCCRLLRKALVAVEVVSIERTDHHYTAKEQEAVLGRRATLTTHKLRS